MVTGFPFRTYPGTHPSKGAFSHAALQKTAWRVIPKRERLSGKYGTAVEKHDTARHLVPAAIEKQAEKPTRFGVIYYGSTSPAMD